MPVLAFVVPTGSSAVSLASSASALTAIALPDLSDIAQVSAATFGLSVTLVLAYSKGLL